ncbi:MAG: nuclear transport factor 2 family protein [Rhodobacteraceae bacterium]|nr:nuclear transport factor 2 family protein [Paracoccaceae bacterium]
MFKSLTVTASALVICATTAFADATANKEIVQNMVDDVFVSRNIDAVDTYFTETYIQRNPMLPSGSAVIKKFLSRQSGTEPEDARPNEVHRMIAEGDLVATHSTYYNFGETPLVAFDIFRIEDGRIAEHWDNLQPLRAAPNPAGRTQTDGWTDVTDLDKTAENKALVIELLEKMFIGGARLDVSQYINRAKYLQHNPDAGDGLKGLQELMAANAAKGLKISYDEIGIAVAEGNFVLTGVAGKQGDTPTAFYDLWRLEDGLIVEHWDVIAPIQTENLPDGYPGKF